MEFEKIFWIFVGIAIWIAVWYLFGAFQ